LCCEERALAWLSLSSLEIELSVRRELIKAGFFTGVFGRLKAWMGLGRAAVNATIYESYLGVNYGNEGCYLHFAAVFHADDRIDEPVGQTVQFRTFDVVR
jgi:hypothetical protein